MEIIKVKKFVKAQILFLIARHQTVFMSDVSRGNEFNESAFNYQTCNGWKDIKAQYKLIHSAL